MKIYIKISMVLCTLILIGIFIFSIIYTLQIDEGIKNINVKQNDKKVPKYHFTVITRDTAQNSLNSFFEGINEAAKEYNAVIEYKSTKNNNANEQIKLLDMAINSQVDGIILQVVDQELISPYIDKAVQRNIPVVTVIDDAPKSYRQSYIGCNPVEIGKTVGRLTVNKLNGEGNVIVILDNYSDIKNSQILNSMKDILNKAENIKIATITSIKEELGTDDIIQDVLVASEDIDLIFCSNTKDTIKVAQALIDMNKLKTTKIIGFGDSAEILRYIDRDIIEASIIDRQDIIGKESVKAMVELVNQQVTNARVDTGIEVINKSNIDDYKIKK